MSKERRPDPDQLLKVAQAEARQKKRGQLKIFFGSSAGVGKTYAMLQAAHALQSDGIDVMIGLVETHNRPDTMKLVQGLPQIPLLELSHQGVPIKEFDLDGALRRKPAVLLLDELAHTNANGSRHPKRWQDVEELLLAGIDVYTTLNVQHLESLNDVVTNITSINVQETVPDAIFDAADEIKLVDTPTDELLDRLHLGKVYPASGVKERAAQNFFNKTNLMSLRELALRRTAEHVDADTDYERSREGVFTANIAGDKVLVCVGPDALAAKLVRTARRVAGGLKAPWYALAIDRVQSASNPRMQRHQQQALHIAEQNGARIITLQDDRIGDAILDFARQKGVTKIIIGRAIRHPWRDLIKESLVEHIIRNSGSIDVYVITGSRPIGKQALQARNEKTNIKNYVYALMAVVLCTSIGIALRGFLEPIDVLMVYLIGIVISASKLGRSQALVQSILSVAAFNFFFVQPFYSFTTMDNSYWLTFSVMLLTSFVISQQASRLKHQTTMSRQQERETQTLYALTKELAASRDVETIMAISIRHLTEALDVKADIWLEKENGILQPLNQNFAGDIVKEEIVAKWAFEHGLPAGFATDTLPSAKGHYYPLKGAEKTFGVLSIIPKNSENELLNDQKNIISTFANLIISALERIQATDNAERSKIDIETEKLRNTFLSSMSHDLRSPLSAITGAADALIDPESELQPTVKKGLIQSIGDESRRLTRVINNLLDLSRFEAGIIKLNAEPYYLQELIGATLDHMYPLLKRNNIVLDVSESLPLIRVDGLLIEQLLQNLLQNAVSFSEAEQPVSISAVETPEGLLLSVSDKGAGIPEGKEKEIFDKFFTMSQGDRPKGTGLGLAICDAIVKAHGGKIWAENNADGGAMFKVLFPKTLFVPELDGIHDAD